MKRLLLSIVMTTIVGSPVTAGPGSSHGNSHGQAPAAKPSHSGRAPARPSHTARPTTQSNHAARPTAHSGSAARPAARTTNPSTAAARPKKADRTGEAAAASDDGPALTAELCDLIRCRYFLRDCHCFACYVALRVAHHCRALG